MRRTSGEGKSQLTASCVVTSEAYRSIEEEEAKEAALGCCRMSGTDAFVAGYGAMLTVGGILGFVRRGSLMSLATGGLIGGYFVYASTELNRSHEANLTILSGLLTIVMAARAHGAAKFMPSGLVAVLSGGMLWYLLNK